MSRTSLVEMLTNHGVRAYQHNGYIRAWDVQQDETGTICEGWVRLRPSLRVIRAFLGY